MSLPVAILAGGLATRLRPITESIPKALVEVAGKPFVEHQVELLRSHGLEDIVFCLGYRGEQVEACLGDGSRWGARLRYCYDGPRLLGTGGALKRALPLLGEAFLVLYGDSYLECDYAAVARAFTDSKLQGLMTVFRNDGAFDRSNVLFRDGRILRYDKRDSTHEMRHIDYGLGALKVAALDRYSADDPLDLAQVYQDLLSNGQLAAYEVADRFYEIGSPEGLAETSRYLSSRNLF